MRIGSPGSKPPTRVGRRNNAAAASAWGLASLCLVGTSGLGDCRAAEVFTLNCDKGYTQAIRIVAGELVRGQMVEREPLTLTIDIPHRKYWRVGRANASPLKGTTPDEILLAEGMAIDRRSGSFHSFMPLYSFKPEGGLDTRNGTGFIDQRECVVVDTVAIPPDLPVGLPNKPKF